MLPFVKTEVRSTLSERHLTGLHYSAGYNTISIMIPVQLDTDDYVEVWSSCYNTNFAGGDTKLMARGLADFSAYWRLIMASEIGVQTIQHTNGTDAMTIDSSGRVLTPVASCISAEKSTSNQTNTTMRSKDNLVNPRSSNGGQLDSSKYKIHRPGRWNLFASINNLALTMTQWITDKFSTKMVALSDLFNLL